MGWGDVLSVLLRYADIRMNAVEVRQEGSLLFVFLFRCPGEGFCLVLRHWGGLFGYKNI